MKRYRAEAEKLLKKNEELTPVLASLQDEHRGLSELGCKPTDLFHCRFL